MTINIKPCPFCGHIPQITSDRHLSSVEFNSEYPNNGRDTFVSEVWYSVECICCKQLKYYKTEQEAEDAWNVRV